MSRTLLDLQRSAGNRAVNFLEARGLGSTQSRQLRAVARSPLQRDDEKAREHLEAGRKAAEIADRKDAAAKTRKQAVDAGRADAVAAKHHVEALHELSASGEHVEASLGSTRGKRAVAAHFFKGQVSEVALVIAGVHGSELAGVEVANSLVQDLSKPDARQPYYSVVVVPELFPDNVDVKRQWEQNQAKAAKKLSLEAYRTRRSKHPTKDPGRHTQDRRRGAMREMNRQFPDLGKPFDPDNPVDSKGRPIERENIMLLTLIDRFNPTRVLSLHAIKQASNAEPGIFADPHPSLPDLPPDRKGLADQAHELSRRMAEVANAKGAQVPGNKLDEEFTSLYGGQDPEANPGQKKTEDSKGRSLGQWAPTQGMVVITVEVDEQHASASPVKAVGRSGELQAHADAVRQVFLGPPAPAAGARQGMQQVNAVAVVAVLQAAGAAAATAASAIVEAFPVLRPVVERALEQAGAPASQHAQPSGEQGVQRATLPASLVRLARDEEAEAPTAKRYRLKPGVVLSREAEAKVAEIATAYYAERNKNIVVTSGTRSPAAQASAMYEKLAAGSDVVSLYRNKKAVKQIKKAYDDAKAAEKSRSEIIAVMTGVIKKQVSNGVYISRHLRAGAVDVRRRGMSAADRAAFRKAASEVADKVILEARPPHWHLQF